MKTVSCHKLAHKQKLYLRMFFIEYVSLRQRMQSAFRATKMRVNMSSYLIWFFSQISARCPRLVVDKMLSIEMKLPTQNTGEQQFPNEAIQGTLAFLHCPKGYHIQGQSVVVCHESQWLPSTDARCEKSIYPILPTEWLYRLPWYRIANCWIWVMRWT